MRAPIASEDAIRHQGACFVVLVAGAAVAGRLPVWVFFLVVIASFAAWFAYAFDKSAALNKRWRTTEDTLHLLSLVGGWPGALIAQRTVRHKTQKRSFRSVFWATVLINCAVLGIAASPDIWRMIQGFVQR